MAEAQRNIGLLLEYDGSAFQGWQIQAAGRTVQGELARALGVLIGESVCPTGSGRTDAGTHALGQVANFRTGSAMPLERIRRGLNGLLPPDLAVRAVVSVPMDFHARYSACSKRYRYRIRRGKAAMERQHVWSVFEPLDIDAMRLAAASMPGSHGFAAFCKQDPVPSSFICRVSDAGLTEQGPEIVFEIQADRFLRHMVRILTGTLVEVGCGRRPVDDVAQLLSSGERRLAGPTAPARGLCLLHVHYPPETGLYQTIGTPDRAGASAQRFPG